MRSFSSLIFILLSLILFSACSTTKFVPQGEYLLDEVKISSRYSPCGTNLVVEQDDKYIRDNRMKISDENLRIDDCI